MARSKDFSHVCRIVLSTLILGTFADRCSAQPLSCKETERSGLRGNLAIADAHLSLAKKSVGDKPAFTGRLGYRFDPDVIVRARRRCWLRIMPHIAYGATGFRGIDEQSDSFGFSHLDVGLDLSVRASKHVRPYVFVRRSFARTIEKVDLEGETRTLRNYFGSGFGERGLGIEVPLTRNDTGLDVGVDFSSGAFRKAEWNGDVRPRPGLSYRSRLIFIGFSKSLREP